jgi:hypothetical protein
MYTALNARGDEASVAGLTLNVGLYDNGFARLTLIDPGSQRAAGSLTVNLPGADLRDDEPMVSADWSLPCSLKAALLADGRFVRVGHWRQGDYGPGEVWRIACPRLLRQVASARAAVAGRRGHGLFLAAA